MNRSPIYCRKNLEAKLVRPVFYQVVDLGVEELIKGERMFGVWSKTKFCNWKSIECNTQKKQTYAMLTSKNILTVTLLVLKIKNNRNKTT